jgi:protein TonB
MDNSVELRAATPFLMPTTLAALGLNPFSFEQLVEQGRWRTLFVFTSCALTVFIAHLGGAWLLSSNTIPSPLHKGVQGEVLQVSWIASPAMQSSKAQPVTTAKPVSHLPVVKKPAAKLVKTTPAKTAPVKKTVKIRQSKPAPIKTTALKNSLVKKEPLKLDKAAAENPLPQTKPVIAASSTADDEAAKSVAAQTPPQKERAASPLTSSETTAQDSIQSASSGAAGVTTAAVFNADYLNNPAPKYPSLSRRLKEQGKTLLRVRINCHGKAETVELVSSSGYQRLDRAARKAIKKWRFVAARQGGKSVASWVLIPINFSLV